MVYCNCKSRFRIAWIGDGRDLTLKVKELARMESLHHVIMEEMESNGMTQTRWMDHSTRFKDGLAVALRCAVAASALPQQRLARKIWAKQKGTGREKIALEPCPAAKAGRRSLGRVSQSRSVCWCSTQDQLPVCYTKSSKINVTEIKRSDKDALVKVWFD